MPRRSGPLKSGRLNLRSKARKGAEQFPHRPRASRREAGSGECRRKGEARTGFSVGEHGDVGELGRPQGTARCRGRTQGGTPFVSEIHRMMLRIPTDDTLQTDAQGRALVCTSVPRFPPRWLESPLRR